MRMRYKANGEFAGFLHKHDLILNYIGGWPFIINKYANAVVKVVPTNIRGEESIGTGFYVTFQEQNAIRHLVVINRHVVEDKPRVKVCNLSNEEVLHSNIFLDNSRDLAFIELIDALNVPPFYLNDSLEILSEIITIGFPTIPMTKEAYQVCHKGEINSFVETYHGNKMFLFSAKTSSGNSGSPILDRNGMVVGIVSEEFFNYDDLLSKGKPAYYAGIPSSEIIDSATMHVK